MHARLTCRSRGHVRQEAGAVRQRPDAEDLGERLPEVGERRARAQVDARSHAGAGRRAAARTRASDRCSASSDRCRGRRSRPAGRPAAAAAAARPAARRTARGWRRTRRRRCDGRTACRSRPGWRRSARGRSAPSAASTSSMPSSSLAVWTARVTPRPAKRSSILPIATTGSPAALTRSSSVSPRGGSA